MSKENRAIRGNRLLVKVSSLQPTELESITNNLTYTYTVRQGRNTVQAKKKTYKYIRMKGEKILALPNTRVDLLPERFDIVDMRKTNPVNIPKPGFTPRETQKEIVDAYCEDKETAAIVQAVPGFGKSITALELASRLQQKTLIVTTTTAIKDMWIGEIKKWFGFEPGVMTGGKYVRRDSPIVVGNFQTVVKFAEETSQDFGLLIIDEMHKCVANTFTDIISVSRAKYRVGLSATLKRTDGLHVLFKDYFGVTMYQPPAENVMEPKVLMLQLPIKVTGWATNHAKALSKLSNDPNYQSLVVDAVNALSGRTTLVISSRNSILTIGNEVLGGALVTGSVNKTSDDREAIKESIYAGDTNLVWGSQSIFSEGVSWNPLDTLVLATPISSPTVLEQCVGRVCREHPGKGTPLIIDICVDGTFNAIKNRLEFYKSKGISVESCEPQTFLKKIQNFS